MALGFALSELATCVAWQGVPWLQVKLVHLPAAAVSAVHETVLAAELYPVLQEMPVHEAPRAAAAQVTFPLPSVDG